MRGGRRGRRGGGEGELSYTECDLFAIILARPCMHSTILLY